MKQLFVSHNNLDYEFRLMERSELIQVIKGGTLTYRMEKGYRLFYCDCPGYKYHGKCWHRGVIDLLLKQPTIEEPWAQWAEEALE